MVDIGEKCTILEGALVESNVVLEPGTVVPAYARIPAGQKWGGNPAQFIQELDDEAKDKIVSKAEAIAEQAQEHIVEFLPIGNTFVHLEDLEQQSAGAK
jgi:carbonic anhydrase/acetyltransferase-like protein (isoleucine patch superfamily)